MKFAKIYFSGNKNRNENGFDDAEIMFNFIVKDGKLFGEFGVNELSVCYDGEHTKTYVIDDNIAKILNCDFYSYYDSYSKKKYGYFVLFATKENNSNALYVSPFESSMNTFHEYSGVEFNDEPIVIKLYANEKDYLLFVPTNSQDSSCLWTNTSTSFSQNIPASLDAIFYDGKMYTIPKEKPHRLFVTSNTSPDALISSQFVGDYLNFSDGLGDFFALKELNGCLYAFRQNGITKIMSSGCGEEFSYKTISFDFSQIFKNTICVCDDKFYMLSSKGVCVFDGIDFEFLEFGFENLIEKKNDKLIACYYDGKYYVALNMLDKTKSQESPCLGMENNSIISVDTQTKKVEVIRGVDVKKLTAINYGIENKIVCCFNGDNKNKLGQISNSGNIFGSTKKVWESYCCNYPTGTKVLKSISLKGYGNFNIKLFVDEKMFEYNILLSNVTKRVNTNLKGEKLKVAVKSLETDAKIIDAKLEFE